jgi:hypothetical protein
MGDIRFAVKTYTDGGWSVVPIPQGKKAAVEGSWSKKTYGVSDFQADDNLAGKCGEPSEWRVDVDCDSAEAVIDAKHLLPQTGLIHGWPGQSRLSLLVQM